ncbi:hypothetical protein TSUD_48980 [Trifolium subterraneum]|uniref:Uncharacterized protein n=1 Tax=Trifolium subterraneum TaxID=3900 RepID=A0A2Z6MYW6_TRISU|nr:hypothetical protein TSUD_48980 [Trifolium subterraneum]
MQKVLCSQNMECRKLAEEERQITCAFAKPTMQPAMTQRTATMTLILAAPDHSAAGSHCTTMLREPPLLTT